MKSKNNKLFSDYATLAALITLWLVSIGVFVNFTTDLFEGYNLIKLIKLLTAFIAVLLFIYFIYKKRKKFRFYSLANEKDMEDDTFKAIILPISPPSRNIKFYFYYFNSVDSKENILNNEDTGKIDTVRKLKAFIEDKNIKEIYLKLESVNPLLLFSATGNDSVKDSKEILMYWLKNDIHDAKINWNWPVPLLIAARNFNKLEHIRLIGTEGDDGSWIHLHLLVFILLCLFNNANKDIDIKKHSIVSSENFTELTMLLDEIEKDLEDRFNYEEEDIAFDITGGQKPASVVGTFFTLKSRTPILYISKEYGFGKIKEINAIINIEPPE
ncbi:MAG: hypothetical protein ACYCTD_03770 [bacterium]